MCSYGLTLFYLLGLFHALIDGSYGDKQCDSQGNCGYSHNVWTKQECERKQFGWDSFVCVCSEEHCDYLDEIKHPTDSTEATIVTSSRDSHRFAVTHTSAATAPNDDSLVIRINPDHQYQSMLGFGGSFTDAAGINIMSLSQATQDALIKSYFAPEGLKYNMARIPIASTDFSTTTYSYDDVEEDVELKHFALTKEDYEYKIPLIKRARAASDGSDDLLLFGSPWSPPAWMKTNNKFIGSGSVRREMWQPYSNYIVKFLDAYADEGQFLWGLTTQNEPLCGTMKEWPFNACVWLGPDMGDWIANSLGPSLEDAGYGNLKIMVSDQIRPYLLEYATQVLERQDANRYVDGFGVHWYFDNSSNVHQLSRTLSMFPDKFLLYTEACDGFESPLGERVKLGDWSRAERYAFSIIESSNHLSSGWVDWNLALDLEGGPNWVSNFVDAPIIVDKDRNSFYKQPMFYALGHFSKFVERGARAMYNSLLNGNNKDDVTASTFVTADGKAVAVVLNRADEERAVSIEPGTSSGIFYNLQMPARSIQTVLFRVA